MNQEADSGFSASGTAPPCRGHLHGGDSLRANHHVVDRPRGATRLIGEQHIREDLGFIPSFADWVKTIRPEPWMGRSRVLQAKNRSGEP
jgi:hypothetical protein